MFTRLERTYKDNVFEVWVRTHEPPHKRHLAEVKSTPSVRPVFTIPIQLGLISNCGKLIPYQLYEVSGVSLMSGTRRDLLALRLDSIRIWLQSRGHTNDYSCQSEADSMSRGLC